MSNNETNVVIALLITGLIILTFYVFINMLQILWTSLSFLLLGLIFCFIFFFNKNKELLISCFLIIFTISFNIYITAIYQDNITQNKVPDSYHSLSMSNIILLYIEIIFVTKNIISQDNFDKTKLLVVSFLVVLSIILLITQMVILKNFTTDG
jgi:hypothetical protein